MISYCHSLVLLENKGPVIKLAATKAHKLKTEIVFSPLEESQNLDK